MMRAMSLARFDRPLTDDQACAFARLALDGIAREYPNKPAQVMVGPDSARTPRQLHPAFFGCFDWHSAVHSHWMLVRLLRAGPGLSVAAEIRAALERSLTPENLEAEAACFRQPHNRAFERMYGWAWLLRLGAELRSWDDPEGARWAAALAPLEAEIVGLMRAYLPRLVRPIRTGTHPDTAFALGQALDYARAVGAGDLEALIVETALRFYAADRGWPMAYEPSGEDFFSPGLSEADLMRRALGPDDFSAWLDDFLPRLAAGAPDALPAPVVPADMTDGKLAHWAGLNLSRAWTMRSIAGALGPDDPRSEALRQSAEDHLAAGLTSVFSGLYEGEHWLGTFAIYAITGAGAP